MSPYTLAFLLAPLVIGVPAAVWSAFIGDDASALVYNLSALAGALLFAGAPPSELL